MKKYELTNNSKTVYGKKLLQIRALVDFGDVKAGSLGGYVEKEENLSQCGESWVYNNAMVFDDAKVYGHARVYGHALVYSHANVSDNAKVYGNAMVYDTAMVYGKAGVYGNVMIHGDAMIHGYAMVRDDAEVYGNADIYGNAMVYGSANIHGNTNVCGNANITSDARIISDADLLQITGLGSSHRPTTVYRTKNGIEITCGCFHGDLEQFRTRVIDTRKGKVRDEYLKFAELIEIYFSL